jgi:RNA polymerase sigma factor (sigma-70 family)
LTVDERFERVLVEYGPALRRVAASWERNVTAREDLLQEILVALWRALPRFRGDCSERAFVFRVATNRALTHRFRRPPPSEPLDETPEIADSRPAPEAAADAAERLERLQRALHVLPLPMRQILTLALEGMSRAEIAEILGITENNAGVRLSRARHALREQMEKR